MKIGKITTNNSNVNIAEKININSQNNNFGISEKEYLELRKKILSFSNEIKEELKGDLKSLLNSPETEKEKKMSTLRSKLFDYGVSLASTLSAEGIMKLFELL